MNTCTRKPKSFAAYKRNKGTEWKLKVSGTPAKKNEDKEVLINIGLLEWNDKENILKLKRGKKLVLRVNSSVDYPSLLQNAKDKWKVFHSNMYYANATYHLVYEDGVMAIHLPGSTEPFSLVKYKEAVNRDYKRITFFLVTDEDYMSQRSVGHSDDEDENIEKPPLKRKAEFDETPGTSKSAAMQQIDIVDTCSMDDEQFAKDLQAMYDKELDTGDIEKDLSLLIKEFQNQVDNNTQFNIVLRRGIDVFRTLSIWKRAAAKSALNNPAVTVQYLGEMGLDTGAIAKEFFTITLNQIASNMFQGGSPMDSTFHVQNGNYRACGQIAAASLAQGGPPPAFMAQQVFNMMVKPEIDLTKNVNDHLTEKDQEQITTIVDDLTTNTDTILEHGYTGPIDSLHKEEIRKSISVSIISKRATYLKEFMVGLASFGVATAVKNHPGVLKELFLIPSQDDNEVNANYLFSILVPQYSVEGSARRKTEEEIMDSFQDFLFHVEDKECHFPHLEATTFDDNENAQEITSEQKADLSIPGIMGWLTGQKHKPIGNESFAIDVNFDHDCIIRNPNHTLCFPIVAACAKQITIPVEHMKSSVQFDEVFLLAFGKGQSFSRA